MPHIIIIGAGIGGVSIAFELRDNLDRSTKITVVSDKDYFQFVPSNPWVAINWRKPEDVKVPLNGVFAKKKIDFSATGVKRVIPSENALVLNDDTRLTYDYLVVATGPKLAFDEIEGLGPQGLSQSVCQVDHAEAAAARWEEFCKDPGPMVVGAVQGASCFGPAYEYLLCAVADLRKRKIRHKVPITFVTSEPYIGHLGLGGVGDTKSLLESVLRDRDVKWITNCKVDRVTGEHVEATEVAEDGSVRKTHTIPARFSMFLPAFRGVDCFREEDGSWIKGLANPRGFILTDKHQRNPTFGNIFAVGVCVAIPPVEQTPVPVGTPKTGYMIESMVAATCRNIEALIAGKEPSHEPTLNAVCLADFGDGGVAFIALPQIPPRNLNWSSQGYWVHLAKVAFEKYFMRKVRLGSSEPGYERLVMKALGIQRLNT